MSLPQFPASLRSAATRGTWKWSPTPELSATDFDQGPPRARRQFTKLRHDAVFTIKFTSREFSLFKSFFAVVINHGADKFTMPIWDGDANETQTVKFDPARPYQTVDSGLNFCVVSFNLTLFDTPLLDEGVIQFISDYGFDNAASWTASVHLWVNTTYPGLLGPYRE